MRLTTKGRFAVTAMIDLGLRQSNGPVTLAAISQRQQISLSYLEQLFGKLRRHGLGESTRGPGGGYALARKASDITVADIIVSVDEPIDAAEEPQGEGHAPGHRHLAPPPIEQPTESRRRRPFGPRYGDRSRQPRR